jgi:hypothetical protein
VIAFRFANLEFTPEGCVTRFPDGTSYGAVPHDTPHYHVIAHRCGYGDDLLAYCREHEACHLIGEEWFHNRPSRIIWGLAHNLPPSPHEAAYEEIAAQALQRWVRTNERPIIGGVDWDGLRDFILEKLATERVA